MSKLIVANWKLNPISVEEAVTLVKASDNENVVIAPPFPFLIPVRDAVKHSPLAAQDVFWEEKGPFTGEVGPSQLLHLGVQYCIVGHSERRRYLHETDAMVAQKVAALAQAGIVPIICIGETKEERDAGHGEERVLEELQASLSLLENRVTPNIIITYEPAWAISTEALAEADTPENAVVMITLMTESLKKSGCTQIPLFLYGGSVKPLNVELFLEQKEIGGALVGGASLKSDEIKKIIQIASRY